MKVATQLILNIAAISLNVLCFSRRTAVKVTLDTILDLLTAV